MRSDEGLALKDVCSEKRILSKLKQHTLHTYMNAHIQTYILIYTCTYI